MNGANLVELSKKIALRTIRTVYAYVVWPVWLIRGGWALGYVLWLRQYGRHRIGVQPVSTPGSPIIVMLVVTALDRDPRVERGARTLAANGFKVTIICPAWRGVSPRTERHRGPARADGLRDLPPLRAYERIVAIGGRWGVSGRSGVS